MVALKLAPLIEKHSEELAHGLAEKLRSSERTSGMGKVPPGELEKHAYEVYRHISDWILTKTESDVELRFAQIGARRAEQGVPFSHWLWVLALTKEHLWSFLQREALADRPVELFGELELLRLLDQFFDRAMYYGSLGYERARAGMQAA